MSTLIGTLSFNTKPNRAKVYNRLRDFSILSEMRNASRGNHHLRVYVPIGKTWSGIVHLLAMEGLFGWNNLGAQIE